MDLDIDFNPISIKKSYEKQKFDFLKILDYDEPLPCCQVNERWKNALELVVEPVGWNAIWKMSRNICSKFDVPYPRTAVVEVQNVDFDNFVANIKLIFSEGDINIPEVTNVPFLHLFPTTEQSYEVIDIFKTADILQDFRVFFNNLWYPWDEKLLGNEDWLKQHFEDRLQLHYDILTGEIDLKIRFTIETLIKEAKEMYERIVKLEEELLDVDKNNFGSPDQWDVATKDMRYLSLCKLQVEFNRVSELLNFYEKRKIRDLMEKDLHGQETKVVNGNSTTCISIVWHGGKPAEFASFLNRVIQCPIVSDMETRFECSDSLDKLLSEWKLSSHCGKLFLSDGTHNLNSRTVITASEGVIRGLDEPDGVTIRHCGEGLCLMDISSEDLLIYNLSIKTLKVKYILLVRSGTCCLKNIKFVNDDETEIGIFVLDGARLEAQFCHFYNFSTAIHASKGSTVLVENCVFENNVNGLEFEECNLSVTSCNFNNNNGYALLMETADSLCSKVKEGTDAFEGLEKVRLLDVNFSGNKSDMAKYY